ncbi:hypothetical protein L1267_15810 [Pseudoalteromonas sp. OFAV1]|uniref:hypothetical protein n=1 Tax=Pseudoalteromonas sp. OFAV1 TaxID=2908892 RepID=UPI001F4662D2|nr:hypothetical protein [Pseudoalteromonas sp. OFAV1]MCF2901842.1 hypothetical protein [Pseudoalteromonas sp. OFAV1]
MQAKVDKAEEDKLALESELNDKENQLELLNEINSNLSSAVDTMASCAGKALQAAKGH